MEKITLNKSRIIIILIFIVGVLLSYLYSIYQLYSLNYYSMDFSFYMQFASKLFDNNITNNYSANPNGFNFFGYGGIDGIESFHKSIHFEPIKYLYALIYKIFKNPHSVFLFRSVLYFSPLLYIAFYFPLVEKHSRYFIVLIALLWLVYPSTFPSVAYDLRPYTFLAPFFFLVIFSIIFNRTKYEVLIFFNILFFSREETLILSIIAILVYISKYGYNKKNSYFIIILLFNWLVWLCIYYYYFNWTDYNFASGFLSDYLAININPVLNVFLIVTICLIAFFSSYLLFTKLTGSNIKISPIFAYSLIFIPILKPEINNILQSPISALKNLTYQFIFHPRYSFHFILIIIFLLIIYKLINRSILRKIIIYILGISIIICLITNIRTYDIISMNERYNQCKSIYTFKNSIINVKSIILVDKITYQAFYDFENIYVMNRLPANLVQGENGVFPNNISYLKKLIVNKIEYIVVSKNYSLEILSILADLNKYQVNVILNTSRFMIFKIDKAKL